jgi:dethiobiotin synthetase
MPQNPQNFIAKVFGSNALVPLNTDASGALLVAGTGGTFSALNITAATVVKAAPGRLIRISVVVAGTTVGTVNDTTTTGAAAASNEIASIANTIGTYELDWPCLVGIVVVPGTGQTVAVSYS